MHKRSKQRPEGCLLPPTTTDPLSTTYGPTPEPSAVPSRSTSIHKTLSSATAFLAARLISSSATGIIAYEDDKIVEGSLTLENVDGCFSCKDFRFKSGPLKADGHVRFADFDSSYFFGNQAKQMVCVCISMQT